MEDYSFVAWIASFLVYATFLLWAFLPTELLTNIGFTYYPSRYYAIALPAYVLVVYVLANLAYLGYNMISTVDPSDFRSFRDKVHDDRRAPSVYQKFHKGDSVPDLGDIDPVELSKLWG